MGVIQQLIIAVSTSTKSSTEVGQKFFIRDETLQDSSRYNSVVENQLISCDDHRRLATDRPPFLSSLHNGYEVEIMQVKSSTQPSSDLLLLLLPELLSETGVRATENDLKTWLQTFTVAVTTNAIA